MFEIFLFLSVMCCIAIIIVPTIYGFVIGAPIVFSPKKAIVEALAECETKKGEKFYDLGSGTGRVMLIVARKFKLAVYGFELSPPLVFFAKINLWLHKVKNTIYIENFYKQDLSDADIIFCFLTPPAMLKLRDKFEKELKPGTKIISYAFHIEGWKPKKTISGKYPGRVFLYEK